MAICCSASQRERATESVPPRACHLERSAPPSAAGVGCGWCSGAVIEQQAPARHAECTRDASRVHALLVQRQTASASAEKGARADSCTPATARAAQRECWLTSGRLTVLGQPGSPAAASDTTSRADAFFRGAAARFRHAVGCGGGRGVRQPRSRPAGGLGGRSHAATTSAKRGVAPGHSRIRLVGSQIARPRPGALWSDL